MLPIFYPWYLQILTSKIPEILVPVNTLTVGSQQTFSVDLCDKKTEENSKRENVILEEQEDTQKSTGRLGETYDKHSKGELNNKTVLRN